MTAYHIFLYIAVAIMSVMLYALRNDEPAPNPDSDPIVRYGALPVRLIGMGLLLWSPASLSMDTSTVVRILCGLSAAWCSFGMLACIARLDDSASRGMWVAGPLVTKGSYQTTRHPFYTNVVLVSINASFFMDNWAAQLFALILAFILYLRIPLEEEDLLKHHGQRYKDYMAKTPRYFPRIW